MGPWGRKLPFNTGITQKDLIYVVAQAELAVAVVTPAVDLSVLQRGHRVGLAAGDAHNLAAPKGRAHFPLRTATIGPQRLSTSYSITCLGVDWFVVVPDPICPQLFCPHEKMSPSAVRQTE